MNSCRSSSRVLASMNSRSGSNPVLIASVWLISPASMGWTACSLICAEDRTHREQAEEQREADEHLARRHRLHAEGVAGEAEHDDVAGEAGHQQEDRRGDRPDGDQQHDHDGLGESALVGLDLQADLGHVRARPARTGSSPGRRRRSAVVVAGVRRGWRLLGQGGVTASGRCRAPSPPAPRRGASGRACGPGPQDVGCWTWIGGSAPGSAPPSPTWVRTVIARRRSSGPIRGPGVVDGPVRWGRRD